MAPDGRLHDGGLRPRRAAEQRPRDEQGNPPWRSKNGEVLRTLRQRISLRTSGSGGRPFCQSLQSCAGVVRKGREPRHFWMKGAVTMTTVTKNSPMNLKHLNDTEAGIDALTRPGLDAALDLSGLELEGGLPPGL